MQLGTRWPAGGDPPAALPPAFGAAVREVEAGIPAAALGDLRWTLTWRERRPWLELDDGTSITPAADGSPRVRPPED
ncbi:MAG: hypothetical protein HY996_08590 [Micrococcales bacterium]|nr:hypothetical protein [Micrococcales bacterium]